MTKTLYLHIGPMKTGTSTIQEVLRKNEEALLDNGYLFLKTGRIIKRGETTRVKGTNHLLGFRMNKTENFLNKKQGIFIELADELSDNPGDNAILSTEVISNRFYNEKKLKSLKAYFEKLGYTVKVIFYVRPQCKIVSSFYVQLVKTRSVAIDFDEYLNDILNNHVCSRFDYFSFLEPWRKIFDDNLIVRPMFGRGFNLVEDFLEVLGIEREWLNLLDDAPAISANRSQGAKTIEAMRLVNAMVNAFNIDPQDSRDYCKHIRKHAKKQGWDKDAFAGVDGETAKIIQDRFHDVNEKLSMTYWNKPWDDMFDSAELDKMRKTTANFEDFTKKELDDLFQLILSAGETNAERTAEMIEWRTAMRN